jgi:hypothetical protein
VSSGLLRMIPGTRRAEHTENGRKVGQEVVEREAGRTVVFVSLEPRSYREAIGGALAVMRPDLDVRVVEPDEIPEVGTAPRPCLVLSGREGRPRGWETGTLWVRIVFHTGPRVRVKIGDGPVLETPGFDLEDLLDLVDGMASVARAGAACGGRNTPS